MNRTSRHTSALLAAILLASMALLPACADNDGDDLVTPADDSPIDDGMDDEPMGEPDMEDPGDDQIETSTLDTCVEDDFGASPWLGPGVVDGAIDPALSGEVFLSLTALQIRDEAASGEAFEAVIGPITEELLASEGLVAATLGRSTACGSARTISIWRDRASMMRFFTTESHMTAVAQIGTISRFYKSTTVALDGTEAVGIEWADNKARLADVPTIDLQ